MLLSELDPHRACPLAEQAARSPARSPSKHRPRLPEFPEIRLRVHGRYQLVNYM